MKADLHDEIMRIAAKPDQEWNGGEQHAYKLGHRDARHAAAELALAASGGNAASPDACPVAITDSSALNGIKWYVKPPEWLADGMNLYFVPAKIVPASAPNAALVAALEKMVSAFEGRSPSGYDEYLDEADVIAGRAALSAAGQEVGHG